MGVGARAVSTNLILYHGIADIFDHATKLRHVLGVFQKPRDLASLC